MSLHTKSYSAEIRKGRAVDFVGRGNFWLFRVKGALFGNLLEEIAYPDLGGFCISPRKSIFQGSNNLGRAPQQCTQQCSY